MKVNYRIVKIVDPTKSYYSESVLGKSKGCNEHFEVEKIESNIGFWMPLKGWLGSVKKFDYRRDAKLFISKKKNLKRVKTVVWSDLTEDGLGGQKQKVYGWEDDYPNDGLVIQKQKLFEWGDYYSSIH